MADNELPSRPVPRRASTTLAAPPRLYAELSSWWPLMSAPEEYAEEAAFYEGAMLDGAEIPIQTMLELGCGGGNNASHLKSKYRMVLTDLASGMLAVSRALNPECEHVQGDMRSLRLKRTFDAVFVHDAICYMASKEDLRLALETAFVHLRPGGVALFAPDHLRENFEPSTSHGGHDEDPSGRGRGMRYVEWCWDPDPTDNAYVVDYSFILRDRTGNVRVVHDRHIEGLFSRAEWLRQLSEVGFQATVLPFHHSELEADSYEIFIATRPA